MQKVIAIDGPSGSGKSTMAKKLASRLNILYIDTGAMYRALAYWADKKGVPFKESDELRSFLDGLKIDYGKGEELIKIEGENLSQIIREHRVSTLASQFSQIHSVRTFLIQFQRELGESEVCVMEGRDISTVVFPQAFCKVFVTASAEVRAQRRLDQLQAQKDPAKTEAIELTYTQVLKDVIERDKLDTEREVSPLKVAEDAYLLDTSEMEPDEVLDKLESLAREKAKENQIPLP